MALDYLNMRLLSICMVMLGIVLLAYALSPTYKICRSDYQTRADWKILLGLIVFFIAGYVAYMALLLGSMVTVTELVVAAILFGGACFVVLVTRMSLASIEHVQTIATRETYNALHDVLTGLPNRKYFFEALHEALQLATKERNGIAVIMIDLDNFKEVNDALGHPLGDKVLRQIAPQLAQSVGSNGCLARLGGDEFSLLLPNATIGHAIAASNRMHDSLQEPIVVDSNMLTMTMSVGIAMFPQHGTSVETLLKKADVAMYHAKRRQLDHVVYDKQHDRSSTRRLQLAGEIKKALQQQEFVLYFQPLVTAKTGKVRGVEALLRWQKPNGEWITPEETIPIAEQTGAIHQITTYVLNEALRTAKGWRQKGWKIHLNANLSSRDLQNLVTPHFIREMLYTREIAPEMLTLEITESALMADVSQACRTIESISRLGVTVAIDDFGTGFSSLSYLRDLPVGSLKIDKSFVSGMLKNTSDDAIVRSTIYLAHSLGCKVTAEGVETEAVAQRLTELDSDVLQGFYYSRPMPADALTEWLSQHFAQSTSSAKETIESLEVYEPKL